MKDSPKTSYQLAKEAGASPIMGARFCSGKPDMHFVMVDGLALAPGSKLPAPFKFMS